MSNLGTMSPERYNDGLRRAYKLAMRQGVELEAEAERWRLEAEQAYVDAKAMKAEGRERAETSKRRMLPGNPRSIDVSTNAFKDMADAKGDFVLFMNLANTYANMAAMKFAKAAAILADLRDSGLA